MSQILPAYFKTSSYASFTRQLNLYGFKKVKVDDKIRYKHFFFRRYDKSGFSSIKRKKSKHNGDNSNVIDCSLDEIDKIVKDKDFNLMDQLLEDIKECEKENLKLQEQNKIANMVFENFTKQTAFLLQDLIHKRMNSFEIRKLLEQGKFDCLIGFLQSKNPLHQILNHKEELDKDLNNIKQMIRKYSTNTDKELLENISSDSESYYQPNLKQSFFNDKCLTLPELDLEAFNNPNKKNKCYFANKEFLNSSEEQLKSFVNSL